MEIREATDDDWPVIWPFFRDIVADGETYAYPPDLTSEGARALWLEPPPGRTVVLVDDDVPGAPVLGFRAMQFNAVVDTNVAAVLLWHTLGFVTVGVVPEAFDSRTHGLVGLHVMHRPL